MSLLPILPRPRRPTRTLRLRLEIILRFPARIVLTPDLRVEASVLAVVGVETPFGDVFAVRLAALAGLGDDAGDVAGGGGGIGGGGVFGGFGVWGAAAAGGGACCLITGFGPCCFIFALCGVGRGG